MPSIELNNSDLTNNGISAAVTVSTITATHVTDNDNHIAVTNPTNVPVGVSFTGSSTLTPVSSGLHINNDGTYNVPAGSGILLSGTAGSVSVQVHSKHSTSVLINAREVFGEDSGRIWAQRLTE